MTDLFDVPAPAVPRDRWDRPLVTPPDGGNPVAYTRCTTFVDCLEDKYHLEQWKLRQVAIGLAAREDLLLSVAAVNDVHSDDGKRDLNRITKKAMDAAKTDARATTGTAVHALCERVDRGHALGTVPAAARRDVAAYQAATVEFKNVHIEQFTVNDTFRVGGTPDRVVRWNDKYYIADIKTGSGIELGAMKIGMQLAMYAHSVMYNPSDGTRTNYPFDLDIERGIVIHLPAGEARAELHFVDLVAGWGAVHVAAEVRSWRNYKNWFEAIPHPNTRAAALDQPTVEAQIANAGTYNELREVWVRAVADCTWEPAHADLARIRREQLERTAQ